MAPFAAAAAVFFAADAVVVAVAVDGASVTSLVEHVGHEPQRAHCHWAVAVAVAVAVVAVAVVVTHG